jgi:hypothetical protein
LPERCPFLTLSATKKSSLQARYVLLKGMFIEFSIKNGKKKISESRLHVFHEFRKIYFFNLRKIHRVKSSEVFPVPLIIAIARCALQTSALLATFLGPFP